MGQPSKLKAISTAKRKSDALDARTLANLLRCQLFPACYVPPPEYEALRRQLRHRALLVRTKVMLKNKVAGLLIENGISYETRQLHGKRYFSSLLEESQPMEEALRRLLVFDRDQIERIEKMNQAIVDQLLMDPLLAERIGKLRGIEGVGEITALTWALETGEPTRFPNARHAISYCGLCAAQRESAGKQKRGPLSKQRNHFLQSMLIEAAHLAIHHNITLRAIFDTECAKGPRHRAVLEVARHLVRYLLAVDRQHFATTAGTAAAPASSTAPPERAFFRHGRSIQ